VEALLDSGTTGLVMSSEFAKKQGFKLKKLERPMNVRNVNGLLNKEGPIEHTVEVNIYYQGHRERIEINVIEGTEMDGNFGNAMVSMPQSRNRLENGRGKNNEVPRGVQKAVEANTGKVGMAEAEGRRSKKRSRKEMRREEKEKEVEERKNSRSEKSSRGVGNLG